MIRLPADEGQLRSMLAQALLDEGHTLELKRELPAGKTANKELARDLAQFTIDSGVLIIGVDEGDVTTPPTLTPVDLAGLTERIEEVAANRVDPPLHVRFQTIPAAGQPGKGYLLVIVPPTPSKIHMVDGRYWARGEKTRYQLSDAEVQRYHQLVFKGQYDAADLLDTEVRRDPAAAAGSRPTPTCS
jgi:predicted HTH transcriptional regulator